MGTKERRERVKQATRQGILDAARRIARAEGWSAVTIRKVADAVEYSPSIVYEYFSSKEEILRTLLQEGFDLLISQMDQAQRATDDPDHQVARLCDAYWQFAMTHPDLYEVMHGLAGVTVEPTARAAAVQAVCSIAENVLLAWADHYNVTLTNSRSAVEIVWSLLHGVASLALLDRIDRQQAPLLLRQGVAALLQGWRAAAP